MATPDTTPEYDSLDDLDMDDETVESAGTLSPEQEMLVEQAGFEPAQGVAIVELMRSVLMEESDYADPNDSELT